MLRSVALHRASVGITIHQAHMRGSSKPGSEAGQSTAGHARSHWIGHRAQLQTALPHNTITTNTSPLPFWELHTWLYR
jgi:hypothetical protein